MQHSEFDRLVDALGDLPPGKLPAEFCREVASLLGVSDVSFALIGASGQRQTLGASSERALTLDKWQFTLDQGPCIDAARTGEANSAPTSGASLPWPDLVEKARDLGYSAIAGVPLAVAGVRFGALDLQVDTGSLLDGTVERAAAVAQQLAPALLGQFSTDPPTVTETTDRDVIYQATGIVAAQLGVPVDDALAALRARAWSDDSLLDHLAQDVVRGDVRLDRP